jgi:hypothetical protein
MKRSRSSPRVMSSSIARADAASDAGVSSLRSPATVTLAPRAANRSAMAAPIPLVPPTTTTERSRNCPSTAPGTTAICFDSLIGPLVPCPDVEELGYRPIEPGNPASAAADLLTLRDQHERHSNRRGSEPRCRNPSGPDTGEELVRRDRTCAGDRDPRYSPGERTSTSQPPVAMWASTSSRNARIVLSSRSRTGYSVRGRWGTSEVSGLGKRRVAQPRALAVCKQARHQARITRPMGLPSPGNPIACRRPRVRLGCYRDGNASGPPAQA